MISEARAFAIAAHAAIDQRRDGGEPYWHHPQRVADIVRTITDDPEMISAAWLHDVIEDTKVTEHELFFLFHPCVVDLVVELTNIRNPGNRAERKRLDRERLTLISPRAQTIKYADVIDNSRSIDVKVNFAPVWRGEQRDLLSVMNKGNQTLWQAATTAVS